MPWLKVDDQLPSHPKSTALEIACGAWDVYCVATLLWRDLGCDCSHNLTEGRFTRTRALNVLPRAIPVDVIDKALAALVASGFIDADTAPHSYVFHDWNDYNPTRDEVLEKRRELSEKRANAGSKGGNTTSTNRKNGKYSGGREPKGAAAEQQTDGNDSGTEPGNAAPPSPSPVPGPISGPKSEPPPTPPQQTEDDAPVPTAKPDPVVVVAKGIDGDEILSRMASASNFKFDCTTCDSTRRADILRRFAAYEIDGLLADTMGFLLREPAKVWPWATSIGKGPVTIALLVGKGGRDGNKTGAMLAHLVAAARSHIAAEREKAARIAAPDAPQAPRPVISDDKRPSLVEQARLISNANKSNAEVVRG